MGQRIPQVFHNVSKHHVCGLREAGLGDHGVCQAPASVRKGVRVRDTSKEVWALSSPAENYGYHAQNLVALRTVQSCRPKNMDKSAMAAKAVLATVEGRHCVS